MLLFQKKGTRAYRSDQFKFDCVDHDVTRNVMNIKSIVFCSRLLGALCCCICDPSVNAVTQEIKPAESLAQLLLFHLNSKSALQRFSVALVICEWAALQKV